MCFKLNVYENVEMLLSNTEVLGSYLLEVLIFSYANHTAFACLYYLHDEVSCLSLHRHFLRNLFSCVLY